MNEHLLLQAIRQDLEWIINAPALLADGPQLWPLDRNAELRTDIPDVALKPLIPLRSRKLGSYFEALAFTLFEFSPNFTILARNEILHHNSITLGELDLLLEDQKNGDIVHLELAIKFYLWTGGEGPQQGWIGAGLHDFFDRKLDRLANHQLPLPTIADKRGAWPTHLPKPDRDLLWMPGRLYLPGNATAPESLPDVSPSLPWRLNPSVEPSYWFEQQDCTSRNCRGLRKAEWLCGKPISEHSLHLPAQFIDEQHTLPIYLLPTGWQTSAQQSMEHYYRTL